MEDGVATRRKVSLEFEFEFEFELVSAASEASQKKRIKFHSKWSSSVGQQKSRLD